MKLSPVFILLLSVRLASVFIVKTFYVPDEYWQSLEVAHYLTFGYGYLTWEWVQGIRSYVYPLAIAVIFKLLELLNLDTVSCLTLLPRILQATLSAYSDYRFFVWTGRRRWALFLIIVSWFWFYIGSRTLSNTLETSLTTIALSFFPWSQEGTAYLWPAFLCCFLRPTAGLIWLPLIVLHLRKSNLSWPELIFKRFLLIGFTVGAICVGIDSMMHGRFLVTPYEFLKYNIVHNIGSFYGAHPWYWYFTIGLPTVLGITVVPFLLTVIEIVRNLKEYRISKYLLFTILFSLCVLSAIDHKEFRFISALLPICLHITAGYLASWSRQTSKIPAGFIASILLFGNALPAWYLSTVHQRASLEVMDKLHDIASVYRDELNGTASILFLMPCHSTPYYSHIHEKISMRFLTCDPNLDEEDDYKDEAEIFFESPAHWLIENTAYFERTAKPSHVVFYEPLIEEITEFLIDYQLLYTITNKEVNYSVVLQFFLNVWHTLIEKLNVDEFLPHIQLITGNNILVFQRSNSGENIPYDREELHIQTEKLDEDFIFSY